jgi:hypothetical protein
VTEADAVGAAAVAGGGGRRLPRASPGLQADLLRASTPPHGGLLLYL